MGLESSSIEDLNKMKTDIESQIQSFADISGAEKNDLPDSAFAYIGKGGKKDESGKTVPRSLRKLPIHDRIHAIAAKQALLGARGGVDIPVADKASVVRKVNAALRKYKVTPMKKEEMSESFSMEDISSVVEILNGAKDASTIEDMKKAIDEALSVISSMSADEVQEEVKQDELPVAENNAMSAEKPLDEKESSKFAELIELNDKLISTLKDNEVQIKALEKMNESLKQTVSEKDRIVSIFEQKEKDRQILQFNNRRDVVATKWISTFKLPSSELESIRQMLSSFSSTDKLEQISIYLDKQLEKAKGEPMVITQQSSVLANNEVSASNPAPANKQEYMESLHKKFLNTIK